MRKNFFAVTSVSAALLLAFPSAASALVFSEVMYDPDGADSGREWVEVYNDGAAPIDLAKIALVESGTRHKIAAMGTASTLLAPGAYAVIADKPDLFSADYPGAAPVFDSTFSLANDGEILTLSAASGTPDIDRVSWTAASAATGGKSWQLAGSGAWIAAAATPAAANAIAEEPPAAATSTLDAAPSATVSALPSAHAETVGLSTYTPKVTLSVTAGRKRLVPPRSVVQIEPAASGATQVSFRWSWGDGATSRGKVGKHSYRFPGLYAVVLVARDRQGSTAVSRTQITVDEPKVALAAEAGPDGFVSLRNDGAGELNLGGFSLEAGRRSFEFPADSIVVPGEAVRVPSDVLGFEIAATGTLKLRYPDGAGLATTSPVLSAHAALATG